MLWLNRASGAVILGFGRGGADLAAAAAVAADRQHARAHRSRYTSPMLPVLLDAAKFKDALLTAKGEERAHVALRTLETLWFNTGTLCNLTCQNCYIESSPRNDRLAYLSRPRCGPISTRSSATATDQADRLHRRRAVHEPRAAGHARGRFVARAQGHGADQRHEAHAQDEGRPSRPAGANGGNLTIRVSLDHYGRALHEKERGARSCKPTIDGLVWLRAIGLRRACRGTALLRRDRGRGARGLCAAVRRSRRGDRRGTTRYRWCCFPRWTPGSTCRRSPRPAGAS